MRRTFVRNLLLIVAAVSLAGAATGAPSTVSYQGRLTNSSGTPVADGSYSVSFSLWTDSVGGTMIWSETQNVPVSGGGLFSTQLGNIQPLGGELVIHGGDNLYLQIALSGQALTPRIALGTVPRAFASSSLNTSTPDVGTLHASVEDDTTKITASHQSAMGVLDSYVHLTDDRALLGLKAYDPAQSQSSSSRSEVMGGTARNYLDHDDDGDAVPDIVEEFSAGDGSAKIGVKASKRRFNLLDAFPQSFRVEAHDSDTASSVSTALETDADVDGIAESGIWEKVDNSEALSLVGVDVDEDGDPDVGTSTRAIDPRSVIKSFFERGDTPTQSQITDSLDETGAYQNLVRHNGSDYQGHGVSLMPDSAVVSTEVSNPSGSSSGRMRTRINELESKLQSIGLLARTSSSSSLTPDSVSEITEAQAATTKARRLVFVSGTVGAVSSVEVSSLDMDDDGISEQEISSKIVPTRSQHAVNTKGTGAQNGRVVSISSSTEVDSATCDISIDVDGDTVPESEISQSVIPTRAYHAIKTKGTGADANRVTSQSDTASASVDVSADAKNIGLYVSNVGGCDLVMTDASLGTIDTTIIIDGALKRFGIGVSQPDYPIHHSSGAHLTSGGVWTNASDENLKENFLPVDGTELLEKIDQLPISEWNYKNESDDVKHIGPTAQDFQRVFGVGENDKTISTIDPSGIALAAIKELNVRNQVLQEQSTELRRQNSKLQAELDALKIAVEQLLLEK